jgi:two-component system sensor histidine kinase VicK
MKFERLGLMMIGASLLVIATIIFLFLNHQRDSQVSQIRAQGISLARVLSRMPLDTLLSDPHHGPLQLIESTQANPDFAYGVIVDTSNTVLVEVAAPAVITPTTAVNSHPSAWFGERVLPSAQGQGRFYEFHAPVLVDGELAAYVRIGYVEPNLAVAYRTLPFFAWIALPIFLLAPLFYYLIRQEIRPLRRASAQIKTILEENPTKTVELEASGEVGEFIRNFNQLMQAAEHRVQQLETEHTTVFASSRVLSYQKARIESVLQSLPEAVIVLDESAAATYANEKLNVMLGVDPSQVINKKPHEWCQQPDLLAFLSGYNGRKKGGGYIEMTPEHNPHRRIAVTGYPLFSPKDSSDIYGTLVVLADVTVEALAKQARKEFVANLSHELKTPLHVIGMYGEMLMEDDGASRELNIEAGNVISDEVERVTSLINNMLSITKIEMGSISVSRRRTRLTDFLKDTFDTAARGTQDNELNFSLEIPTEMSPVNVDKDLLRVALNNLLTNAIKYNKPGGQVVLGAEETEGEIRIFVRDTGIGISCEDQSNIFDRFFRAEQPEGSETGGHGLGLSLAKEIVEIHWGELQVSSTPGEGSEFTILLKKSPILLKEAV